MPLKKIQFKSGVNRENTRYTTEGGYYESEKIRFRQGTPEAIGGWKRISASTFLGVCRSLWNWVTLGGLNLMGVGTHLKFYIESGGVYNDITPYRVVNTLNNPFATQSGSSIVTVTDASGGFVNNDFVTFSNATTVGGLNLNGTYQITYATGTTYTIDAGTNAGSTTTGGGSAVYALYEINVGTSTSVALSGWGGGGWGTGTWGIGTTSDVSIRLWTQSNYGQDLIFGPRGGPMYYWNSNIGVLNQTVSISIASPAVVTATVNVPNGTAIQFNTTGALPTGLIPGQTYYAINSTGTTFNVASTATGSAINTSGSQSGIQSIIPRGIPLTQLAGASDVPTVQNTFIISDTSRFVIAFGVNDYGSTTQDPMLIRWSDQENAVMWTPAATNQAGSVRLSHGSKIISSLQSRQEILVWTDSTLYSLQYLGPPIVWGSQLLTDNISIISQNATAIAAGVVYWMGIDKFYKYDGRSSTLRCDLRKFIYSDINMAQADQIFAATNEGFNEVWWFYCSADSSTINRYVVFNYAENGGEGAWYYGSLARTAWVDSGLRDFPVAATYSNNLVNHEDGVDDEETATPAPINSYIMSSQFDIDDGHNFSFIWRVLPDVTFRGSTAGAPAVTMTLLPLQNSGSGYNNPLSVGGSADGSVVQTGTSQTIGGKTYEIDQFTGQINTRVRGRQMSIKIEANQIGTTWQLGSPRLDVRPDGRK
jgi:hypothetical protein